jgi:hypothetical protein
LLAAAADHTLSGQFVPAAEQSGLIVDIGAWSSRRVARRWPVVCCGRGAAAPGGNVSVFSCIGGISKLVRHAQNAPAWHPSGGFEVTESVFADEEALATLHKLAALGVYRRSMTLAPATPRSGTARTRCTPSRSIAPSSRKWPPISRGDAGRDHDHDAHALGGWWPGRRTMSQLEFLRARRLRAGILPRASGRGSGHYRFARGAKRQHGQRAARHGLNFGRFDRSVTEFAKLRQL